VTKKKEAGITTKKREQISRYPERIKGSSPLKNANQPNIRNKIPVGMRRMRSNL
jgi:hypothetical protein